MDMGKSDERRMADLVAESEVGQFVDWFEESEEDTGDVPLEAILNDTVDCPNCGGPVDPVPDDRGCGCHCPDCGATL